MLVPDAASAPSLADLASIMKRLRDPQTGCAWDREQTFETIAPYTIEEAYEVADAIERGDMTSLVDELGDLQLQIVFHSRIAEEAGRYLRQDDPAASSHLRRCDGDAGLGAAQGG
jgi:ATP diphosphatase